MQGVVARSSDGVAQAILIRRGVDRFALPLQKYTRMMPFDGLVATNVPLPLDGRADSFNLWIDGQWDYEPTVVAKSDGTFDLYTSLTPQSAGTGDIQIWFQNKVTENWEILDQAQQTVKPNAFNATVADETFYDLLPRTRFQDRPAEHHGRFQLSSGYRTRRLAIHFHIAIDVGT